MNRWTFNIWARFCITDKTTHLSSLTHTGRTSDLFHSTRRESVHTNTPGPEFETMLSLRTKKSAIGGRNSLEHKVSDQPLRSPLPSRPSAQATRPLGKRPNTKAKPHNHAEPGNKSSTVWDWTAKKPG